VYDEHGRKIPDQGELTFEKVKGSIDNGRPIIIGFHGYQIGHIIVIIGYTADGYIVVNDTYKDIQNSTGSYNNNGSKAIYRLNAQWDIYYAIEIRS
jgi:hypothetical protein